MKLIKLVGDWHTYCDGDDEYKIKVENHLLKNKKFTLYSVNRIRPNKFQFEVELTCLELHGFTSIVKSHVFIVPIVFKEYNSGHDSESIEWQSANYIYEVSDFIISSFEIPKDVLRKATAIKLESHTYPKYIYRNYEETLKTQLNKDEIGHKTFKNNVYNFTHHNNENLVRINNEINDDWLNAQFGTFDVFENNKNKSKSLNEIVNLYYQYMTLVNNLNTDFEYAIYEYEEKSYYRYRNISKQNDLSINYRYVQDFINYDFNDFYNRVKSLESEDQVTKNILEEQYYLKTNYDLDNKFVMHHNYIRHIEYIKYFLKRKYKTVDLLSDKESKRKINELKVIWLSRGNKWEDKFENIKGPQIIIIALYLYSEKIIVHTSFEVLNQLEDDTINTLDLVELACRLNKYRNDLAHVNIPIKTMNIPYLELVAEINYWLLLDYLNVQFKSEKELREDPWMRGLNVGLNKYNKIYLKEAEYKYEIKTNQVSRKIIYQK